MLDRGSVLAFGLFDRLSSSSEPQHNLTKCEQLCALLLVLGENPSVFG